MSKVAEEIVKNFYADRPRRRERKVLVYGEITENLYYELSTGPGLLRDTVIFGVSVVRRDSETGKCVEEGKSCKACGSEYAAKQHIKALRIAHGTYKRRKPAKKKVAKADEPRKRGQGLHTIRRKA